MITEHLDKPLEQAGYLDFRGAHLHVVLHEATDPMARVLLVGPFAPDRHFSYVPWVRWARYLADRRIEALRFDYRGVGESTGIFEEMGFGSWTADVQFLASWLRTRSPDVPVILHGLGLGALLASKAFAAGAGDGLLCWSVPKNANEVLRRALSHRVAADQMSRGANDRKSLQEYVRQLEADQHLEVDGYRWTGQLWRESFEIEAPFNRTDDDNSTGSSDRPIRVVKLDRSAALLSGSSYLVSLNPDLTQLFAGNFEWIAEAVTTLQIRHQ